MINPPKTEEEARARRYNIWAGNSKGNPYRPTYCAYEVCRGYLFSQCSRRYGHGQNGLYCKQHAKLIQ